MSSTSVPRQGGLRYGIKAGYEENAAPSYFVDQVTSEHGVVYQPDVYTLAEFLARQTSNPAIVDVGCGWADKLADLRERNPTWTFAGVDFGQNIEFCRRTYAWGRWIAADLEQGVPLAVPGAVVICSDVIEHLRDPLPLLSTLRGSQAHAIVLSTPERDLQHGRDHMGPPPNVHHVREWNSAELWEFLERGGLRVEHLGLTRSYDGATVAGGDPNFPFLMMATTLAICTPMPGPWDHST
jgi:hypothetical protein